ncbi:surface-adhesin E family protein [Phenylobacterium sp. CCH9-H3]|uniref:surface-adhesin E family protein n=2 Tax=unclassified Phenylobacterium TaxID=2640670 RepID=UPI00083B6313|nr:surface-adhesin E family protein [Phenylobacterium sp. CCH9-H3]
MGKPLIRLRIFAAAVAATLLASASAQAKIFYITQSGPDAWTVMDASGIETTPGSPVRKAWAVRVQRNILSGNPPTPGYVRTLTEYDCDAQRTRWREFSAFSRSGGLLVSKVNPRPEWGPANEASDTYSAFRVVCEGVGGGSVVSADSVAKVVINLMGSWDPPPEPFAPITPATAPPAKGAAPAAKLAPKR